jgi:tetratricopeptide (TPR) repeat protein
MKMRAWVTLGFSSLICFHSITAADAHWTRIASPNFEMYTTAGERNARDTIRYFEQVRGFFAQMMPHALEKRSQVRILAFNSEKEYAPYRLNDYATAYYHASGDHDYIVMSHAGAEAFPVAIHEYVHLIARHSKLNFPPWLSEGIAELYSTLKPMGDKVLIGAVVPGRYQALLRDPWVPLASILAATPDSPFYNEKNQAGSLYNQGWALTHMLALTPQYKPKFTEVLLAISGGAPSADVLERTYGKSLNAIEGDLIAYLRGGRFQGVLIPAKLEKMDDDLKAEPAGQFDVSLLLAEVTDQPGKEQATRAALESLIAQNPSRPEPYVDLAYLDRRQKQFSEAYQHFEKAFDLGSRDPQMLWDYGRQAASADLPKSILALTELLKLDSGRLDVRLELASVQLRSHAAKVALETLAPVKKVTPEDAPRLLTLLVYANLEAGDRETARKGADQLKKVAATADDRDRADQILRFIDGSRPGAATPAPAPAPESPVSETGDQAPVLKHREPARPAVPRLSITGKFMELQCGTPARIVMETAAGKKVLLIDNPSNLTVNGDSGQTMELACGQQKRVKIRVEYDSASVAARGSDGLARVIHFEP